MTDDIRALLEELREIDIETWKDVRFHLINIFSVNDLGDINLRSPLLQNAYSDIIQGCIQRAIAEKPGWSLILNQYNFGGNRPVVFQAAILIKRYVNGEELKEPTSHLRQEKESLAAAILAAYIQAKRAMR